MIMQAVVIEVQRDRLLVLDLNTRQRVIVNTPDARWFRPDDLVRIRYSGAMTNSIPPQIFAQSIVALQPEIFPPIVQPPVLPPVLPIFPPILPPVVRPPHVIFPPFLPPHKHPGHRPPRPPRPRGR